MARNFRRHRVSHPIADLNVTNLIDLGFMLLIIFMIVAIPSVFGYNLLLGNTRAMVTELENYASALADRIELESK